MKFLLSEHSVYDILINMKAGEKMTSEKKTDTKKLAEMGMLTAVALIIFIIEARIPNLSPVPGMKLGLANIVTVYAVYRFRAHETALIVLARIILGSVFCGNVSVMLYSMSGAALCLAGMLFIRKIIPEKYLFLASAAGAVFHNTGQTIAAMLIMKTTAVAVYWPFLVVSGIIAGIFTGLCAGFLLKKIKK